VVHKVSEEALGLVEEQADSVAPQVRSEVAGREVREAPAVAVPRKAGYLAEEAGVAAAEPEAAGGA
jgi:hypothetical protein